ncbi:MAG: nicotinate (nicotinamide) nucleotide adenylyltransferase [Desulfobacteraceae bacterium]|nr:nicotinate (nicotinamide) nucleotide adenylyltransferase [Desulfobacteraceae bacterium]MBC2720745.1 nicotinate (nicotinamide) nucleotide adenylyltransferase [Desulfobacteraceae bacterium]
MEHIGLFGGTFNPIHVGHIRAIQEVQKRYALDKFYIIPAALPPHKEPGDVVDAKWRLEMIRLSVSEYPELLKSVIISDVELKRSGPSYSIDTVNHFKSVLPDYSRLYFILGIDAFLEIDTWKSFSELFYLTSFIVMTRPKGINIDGALKWKVLEDYIKGKISDTYKFSISRSCFVHHEKQKIFFVDIDSLDISSTQIRNLIKKGRPIKLFVPKKVEDFIINKGLYI